MVVGAAKCCEERLEGGTFLAPVFRSDLGGTAQPARGLLYSLVVHALLAIAFLVVPWSQWLPSAAHLTTTQSVIQQHEVLLLPKLEPMGSDSAGAPSTNGGGINKEEDASSYDAKAVQGVVYKGPQLIVSNSSHPDNFIQTIRQPDLASRPKLPAPLPLPPMVSLAPAKQIVAPPAPQPAPDVAHENLPVHVVAAAPIILQQQLRVAVPKLPLPVASSEDALLHAAAAAVPTTMPGLAHRDPPVKTGKNAHNILVVDAISHAEPKPAAIPAGELFGTFTVSPTGATAMGLAGGGTESKGAPGMANTSGAGASPYAGNGHKASSRSTENSAVQSGVGPGAEAGHNSSIAGHGTISGGKVTGDGSGMGIRITGNGSGSGAGTGSGSGSSPFPSIMIQGGISSGGRGLTRVPVTEASSKSQSSYGLTIVANGASGGGFKDIGVFRNEASYTVYLDMADAGAAAGSSWTLQYALNSHRAPGSPDTAPRSRGSLSPPYATAKLIPHVSSEIARKTRGGTIVVFGVINPQGKFEDLRIMQSPDASLNQSLIDSLRKWAFRPAEMDGTQVSVKVLLGVSVNSLVRD